MKTCALQTGVGAAVMRDRNRVAAAGIILQDYLDPLGPTSINVVDNRRLVQRMTQFREQTVPSVQSKAVSGKVLVTGATGFIGSHVVLKLSAQGWNIRPMARASATGRGMITADLLDPESLQVACEGVEAVIHCAGHAHAFDSFGEDDARRHYETNVVGTRNLVEAAGRSGVRRFLFLSSVKAMGAPGSVCASESWPMPPTTPYGKSKREAERIVCDDGIKYGMAVTNLRLAMVYGRGSRGNLERMAKAVRAGWFPPLPESHCRRSLIHVSDVVEAIAHALPDRVSWGKTYIVADGQTYSGAEIYELMCRLSGRSPSTVRVPPAMLRLAGLAGDALGRILQRKLALNSDTIDRLLGPECYSAEAIRLELGWQARMSLEDGLRECLNSADPAAPGVTECK